MEILMDTVMQTGLECTRPEEYQWGVFLSRKQASFMAEQEAELCFIVDRRSRIHCYGELLHTSDVDEANVC